MPHDLHLATTAGDFAQRFARRLGKSAEECARWFSPPDNNLAIVTAGSIPLGIGTQVSDLDMIVVVSSLQDVVSDQLDPRAHATFVGRVAEDGSAALHLNVVLMFEGVELDWHFIPVHRLRRLLAGVAVADMMLESENIRLLSRLMLGWTLASQTSYECDIGEELRSSPLSLRCAVKYWVAAAKALRGAEAALAEDLPLALHLARGCVEKAFEAYFAARGFPMVGDKWLRFLRLRGLSAQSEPEFSLLSKSGVDLLSPPGNSSAESVRRYVEEVRRFAGEMRGLIDRNPRCRLALRLSSHT